MISVSELKEACEKIEREYGSDSKVVIQIRNEDGSSKYGGYALDMFYGNDGTLFLTNKPSKYGNYE